MPISVAESAPVATLYDSPEGQLGPLLFGGHLHWGYWDQSSADASFAEASDRLAQIMIDLVQIQPGQRFIDLGCGVGMPAIKLSSAKGCHVDGITISKSQQQSAAARALAAGMQDKLHFIHGTALAIPRDDRTYDAGWFFESIFHMGHKAALHEAARVLKPGATLALTDLPLLSHTTDEFKAFVREHIHSTFVAKEDYPALLEEAGFELLGIDDITQNVMPWLVPKFKETLAEHRQQIDALGLADAEKEIDNWIYLFEYMSENLGYTVVTAKKK
jgi:cyclopropane fatty-acyl-phospholipid synthase-like methyltransferase